MRTRFTYYREKSHSKPVRAMSFVLSLLIMFSMLFVGNVGTIEASAAGIAGTMYFDFSTENGGWWNGSYGTQTWQGIYWTGDNVNWRFDYLKPVENTNNTIFYLDISSRGTNATCTNFVLLRMNTSGYSGTGWPTGSFTDQSPGTANSNYPVDSTYNCFKHDVYYDSAAGTNKYPTSWYNYIVTTSNAGKKIYFKDFSGLVTSVQAEFSTSKTAADSISSLVMSPDKPVYNASKTSVQMTGITSDPTKTENGLFEFTVPEDDPSGAYASVKFKASDASGSSVETEEFNLSDIYSGDSEEEYRNTFYFGAAVSSDNRDIAQAAQSVYWNITAGNKSLENETLYFDNGSFPKVESDVIIKVNGTEVGKLTFSTKDNRYYYDFVGDSSSATQSDTITVVYDGKEYNFLWLDLDNYNVVVIDDDGNAHVSSYYEPGSIRVYFDATLSKLSYSGDSSANDTQGIGANGVWCYYESIHDGKTTKKTESMTKAKSVTKGKNTWNDVYYVDIPKGNASGDNIHIRFAGYSDPHNQGANGRSTGWIEVPTDTLDPCFYADTSDPIIYDGGVRGGYWDTVYKIHDAESGKGNDVVDIQPGNFRNDSSKLYVDTTFYDYYSDYELSGLNRDNYPAWTGASFRNWYVYRQFNQALSDYYKANTVSDPLYEGHFQPNVWRSEYSFSNISSSLNLFGYANESADNYYRFMSNNNSLYGFWGGSQHSSIGCSTNLRYHTYGLNSDKDSNTGYLDLNNDRAHWRYPNNLAFSFATWGLVNEKLVNDQLCTSDGNGSVALPYFDEAFLSGTNSKNTKLGDVYENVTFPFTKTTKTGGVEYWQFDAAQTTLQMQKDNAVGYFLQTITDNDKEWSRNRDSGNDIKGKELGFFPFNSTKTTDAARYNYGYGMKMEFTFRLTEDGEVEGTKTNSDGSLEKYPIQFEFSGDDDVWVFIDGQLVLDVGGEHGKATGTIDFAKNTSTVSAVKASVNYPSPSETSAETYEFKLDGDTVTETGNTRTVTHSTTKQHTLVMYYMERGMWESNLKVEFNFPDNNEFQIEKEVDIDNVNTDIFPEDLFDNATFAYDIKNLVTHYGDKDATGQNNVADVESFAVDFDNITKKPAYENTNAEQTIDPNNSSEKVLVWSSSEEIEREETKKIDERLVTFGQDRTSSATIDANTEYMRFMVYSENKLDLTQMYIRLYDGTNYLQGHLNSSRLMGLPELSGDKWGTVRVLLDQLNIVNSNGKTAETFDKSNIQSISFQYDGIAKIYLNDFVFQDPTTYTADTTFSKSQSNIADYGSANGRGFEGQTAGQLSKITGAVYMTSITNADGTPGSIARTVGRDSQVFLNNGQSVTFVDQFRRGSYIYLNEVLTEAQKALYTPSWTLYEDGKVVTTGVNGSNGYITNGFSPNKTLQDIQSSYIYDNRTEQILHSSDTGSDGKPFNNDIDDNAYSKSGTAYQPTVDGQKVDNNNYHPQTIVFRSYSNPDDTVSNKTKLKVVYTNTVNVGSLTVQKEKAGGSQELTEKYKFYVVFYNVGGVGLEDNPIYYGILKSTGQKGASYNQGDIKPIEISVGESFDIQGIPVGTEFRIHEVHPSDGSSLQSVYKVEDSQQKKTGRINDQETSYVVGSIDEDDTNPTYVFYNYKYSIIIDVKKEWKGENGNGNTLSDEDSIPESITVRLQHYIKKDDTSGYTWENYYDPDDPSYGPLELTAPDWSGTFTGLPMFEDNDNTKGHIKYRVVECDPTSGSPITNGSSFEYGDGQFNITYSYGSVEYDPSGETERQVTPEEENVSAPPEIQGSTEENRWEVTVTNTYQKKSPATISYKVIKKWQYANGYPIIDLADGTSIILKLQSSTDDTDWTDVSGKSITITKKDGKLSVSPNTLGTLKDIEDGDYSTWEFIFIGLSLKDDEDKDLTYRVIEVEPDPDDNYLMQDDPEHDWDNKTSTIVNIQKAPELPSTGSLPSINYTLIGTVTLTLSLIAFQIYRKRKNRAKGVERG